MSESLSNTYFEKRLADVGITFPERVRFLLMRDGKTGTFGIILKKHGNAKIKLQNIKLEDTEVISFDQSVYSCIGVYDFNTFDEFLEKYTYLKKRWVEAKEEAE